MKIKILQFPIANTKGGTTQYVINNWKNINKEKFQFDFATLSKKIDFEDELVQGGCKVHYISCYAEANRIQFENEMREILKTGYDIVHLHTNCWKSCLVEEIAREVGISNIIVHAHNTMVLEEDCQKREEAIRLHNQVKNTINDKIGTDYWACSTLASDWLFGDRISHDKIKIMKNGIALEKFRYNQVIRQEVRQELNLQSNFVIGHVGRFVYQKNHEFLIDIFESVKKEIKNAKLVLVGVGPMESTIKSLVKDKKLQNDIIFLEKRTDVNRLMQGMDLFALPSRFEGLGMVLIEAQAAGLKVLTSKQVPKDVELTNLIQRIELDKSVWIDEMIKSSVGYERKDTISKLKEAGYDLCDTVSIVEQEYINMCLDSEGKNEINEEF